MSRGAGSDGSGTVAGGGFAPDTEGSAFDSSFPPGGSMAPGSYLDSGSCFMGGGSGPFEWTDPVWPNLLSGESHSIVRLAIAMAVLVALGWVVKHRWKQGPLEWALHRLTTTSPAS